MQVDGVGMERLTVGVKQRCAATVRERVDTWARAFADNGRAVTAGDKTAKADSEIAQWIREQSQALVLDGQQPFTDAETVELRGFVSASFGVLPAQIQQLVDTDLYSDIHVMGTRLMVGERRDGRRDKFPSPFGTDDEFMATVRRWASTGMNREFSDASPILDMVLGERIRVAASFAVSDEPELSLRISSEQFRTLEQLRGVGMFSRQVDAVLRAAMRAGVSILVEGETGSGKTTLLCALLECTDPLTRVVVVEDEREIRLDRDRHDGNIVYFAARPPNMAGEGAIPMSALVRASLRKRPNIVVVGECRGPEAFELLKVSRQGNTILASLHATSPLDMADRLALFVAESNPSLSPEYVAKLIGKGVHLIVHLDVVDHKRIVSQIVEVTGAIGTNLSTVPWFSPNPTTGAAELNIPTRSIVMDRLLAAGLNPDMITPGPLQRALQ